MKDIYALDSYRFTIPEGSIATYPVTPRDHSRLMIVDRKTGSIDEGHVFDLPDILSPQDSLIFNDSKVIHASLKGTHEGRSIDCLLTKKISAYEWSMLAKPARRLQVGARVLFLCGVEAIVEEVFEQGERRVRFSKELSFDDLTKIGSIPLPPYMKRRADPAFDEERYQTIYGRNLGSVAAPTAGLHFTETLFAQFKERRISMHFLTLHVGTGTFLPIRVEDIRQHEMHYEFFELSESTAVALTESSSRRIAVGTTSCRVLETIVDDHKRVRACQGSTNLFLYPGCQFRYIDGLFTNFHTPESSLLVLVAAFMGYDLMVEAYTKAIERKFRLFSYGDAMLIL